MIQFLFSALILPWVQRLRKWIWNFEMRLISTIEG